MNRLAWVFSTSALLLAMAAPLHAEEIKIGYVDMARALNDVDDGKAAKIKLKNDFEQKQKRLDTLQSDFKRKKDDFDKRQSALTEASKKARQQEMQQEYMQLQQEFVQLQQTHAELQQDLEERKMQITQDITKKLRAVIEKTGDRDNYLLILSLGEAVLYNKQPMEITTEVIREYNKLYGKK